MEPFRVETGSLASLPAANVDTDVIMPKQFLKGITRDGLARGVFHDLRFDEDGRKRPDFVLNRPGFETVSFLLVGPNFGCGSSREHAVWGLRQFGIRAIIGTSFGNIFYDNCFNNGLLAIVLAPQQHDALQAVCRADRAVPLVVDLVRQEIAAPELVLPFAVDALRRRRLLAGLDAVGATLHEAAAISAFEARYRQDYPWTRVPRSGAAKGA
jgi:3-isopropylmalate/(R)-2-methylmalate dehydratase small subunit